MFVPNPGNPLHQQPLSSYDSTVPWRPISTNKEPIMGIKLSIVHPIQGQSHNLQVSILHPSSGQMATAPQLPNDHNTLGKKLSVASYAPWSIEATTSHTQPTQPQRIPISMTQALEQQDEGDIEWQLLTSFNLKPIIAELKINPFVALPAQAHFPQNMDVTSHHDDLEKAAQLSREMPQGTASASTAHRGNLRTPTHLHDIDGSRNVNADRRISATAHLYASNAVASPPILDIKSDSDYNNSINNRTLAGPRNLSSQSTSPSRPYPHFRNRNYVSAPQQLLSSQPYPNHDTHPSLHAQGNAHLHRGYGNIPSEAARQEPTVNNAAANQPSAHVPPSKPTTHAYSRTARVNYNMNWDYYPREAERLGVDAEPNLTTEPRYRTPSCQVVPGSCGQLSDSSSSRGEGPVFKDAKPTENGGKLTRSMAPAPANPGENPEMTTLVDGFFSVLGSCHPVEGLDIRLDSFGGGFQNNVGGTLGETVIADGILDTRLQAQRAGVPQTDSAPVLVDMESGHKDGFTGIDKSRDRQALGSADKLKLTAKPTREGLIPVVELPILRRDKGKGRAVPLIAPVVRKSVRAPEETIHQKERGDVGKRRPSTVTNATQVTPRNDASTEAKNGNTAQRSKDDDSVEDDGGERGDSKQKRKRPRTLTEEIFGDSSDEQDVEQAAEDDHDTGSHNATSYNSIWQAGNGSNEVIELTSLTSSGGHRSDEEDGNSNIVEIVGTSRSADRRTRDLKRKKKNPIRRTGSPASSRASMPKPHSFGRKHVPLTRTRRRPNPAHQKYRPHLLPTLTLPRVIEWVNELNRLNYLLELGKVSEKDSRDLDDLFGMINANKEHPMLSWEMLRDAKLAVALRPFRHKSAFSPFSRVTARGIYAFWAERWEWAYSAGDV